MKTTTKGIVIREQTVGESDRLVTLLTADFGIVKAFVRRANNIKNKNVSSTSLFAYADFSLYKGKDAYLALAYLLFDHILALAASIGKGVQPDTPCPSGSVNRVVKGVTIHPLNE